MGRQWVQLAAMIPKRPRAEGLADLAGRRPNQLHTTPNHDP